MRVRYGTFVHLTYMFFALAANIVSRLLIFGMNLAKFAGRIALARRIFHPSWRSSSHQFSHGHVG